MPVYNAAAAFSASLSGSNPWSYGYSSQGDNGYAFTSFDNNTQGLPAFPAYSLTKSGYFHSGTPTIWRNLTNDTHAGVGAGQLSLHPGPSPDGDYVVLRFTAPAANTYTIKGGFRAGDSGRMNGRVLKNGAFVTPLQTFQETLDTSAFSIAPIALQAGDTLDFVVGNNGNFGSGNTPIELTVSAPDDAHDVTSFEAVLALDEMRNPAGTWAFGYSVAGEAAYSFIPFDENSQGSAFPQLATSWTKIGYVSSGTPTIWKNLSNVTQYGVRPGQVSLHPGPRPNGDYAILRFIAPKAGTYAMKGQFFGGDIGSMSGRVIVNNEFNAPICYFPITEDSSILPGNNLTLSAGDVVDFIVGNNGSFGSGNTPLEVTMVLKNDSPTLTINEYLDGLPRLVTISSNPGVISQMSNLEPGVTATQRTGGQFVSQYAEVSLLKTFADVVWPGAMVQGSTINKSNYAPIVLPRAGGRIRIATNLTGGTGGPKYRDLPEIGPGAVGAALEDIIRQINPTGSVGAILKSQQYASTLREAMVKVGVAYNGPSVSASLDAKLNSSSEEKSLVLLFTQEFYTAAFDLDPNLDSPFFAPSVTLTDVRRWTSESNPALYVNEVKYGRLLMIVFTSSLNKRALEAVVKFAYSGVKASGETELKENVRRVTSNVVSIGSTGAVALKTLQATTPEELTSAVSGYLTDGIDFSINNPGTPIAFSMRYAGSRTRSTGPSALAIAQMVVDEGPEVVSCSTVEVPLGTKQVWDGPGGGWVDTGWDIKPGDTVSFTATGTNWSGVFASGAYDARGWYTWDKPAEASFPINNRSPYCLIARFDYPIVIGKDKTVDPSDVTGPFSTSFYVGTANKATAGSEATPAYGRLFLGTNDNDPVNGDANRKFTVQVNIKRAEF